MRAELDDNHELVHTEQPDFGRWSDEVFRALQALPDASLPPACEWDKPAGQITAQLSASTSVPTDVAPYYLSALGVAIVASFAAVMAMNQWS